MPFGIIPDLAFGFAGIPICIQAVLCCHRRNRRSGRQSLSDRFKFLLMAVFLALLFPIAVFSLD